VFIIFIAAWLIKEKEKSALSYQSLIIVSAVIGIGILSSFLNNQFLLGFIEILHFSIILIISWMISSVYSKNEILKFMYRFSVVFVGVYLIYFTAGYVSHLTNSFSPLWPAGTTFEVEQFTGIVFSETLSFSFIRFFNHIQTWTLPILICLMMFVYNKTYKIFLFVLLALWWALLIQSGGRGTFLAVTASFAIVMFLFTERRKERFYLFSGSLAAGVVTYLAMFYSISKPFRDITREGMSGRMQMWEKAWAMFLENPIFGKGPLSYSIIENGTLYFAHPHNFYLQILSEWGLIVFVIFLALLTVGIYKIVRKTRETKNHRWKELEIGLIWSLGAAFLHAGLSQVFHSPLSQLFLIFFLAWWFTSLQSGDASFQIKTRTVAILSVILISAFIYLNTENISNSFNKYESYVETYETNRLYPRIWEQGLNE